MLRLIIEKNIQIRKMEEQIEELLKEKLAAQVATNPNTTVQTSSIGTELSASLTTTDTENLTQDLAIHKQDHEKLQHRFQILDSQKIRNDTLYMEEMQKSHKL